MLDAEISEFDALETETEGAMEVELRAADEELGRPPHFRRRNW
jgi:hypothetical protein